MSYFCFFSSEALKLNPFKSHAPEERKIRVERSPKPDKTTGGLFGDAFGSDNSSTPASVGGADGGKTPKIGFLPLPPGYNKLVIPLGNVSKEIFVMVHLSIREILDVDSNEGVSFYFEWKYFTRIFVTEWIVQNDFEELRKKNVLQEIKIISVNY